MRLPEPRPISARFSAQLDCFRWVAALLVCTSHLRSLALVDYDPAVPHAWGARLFYALHGYGHEAVMIFFVLSGYLVGGEVLRHLQRGVFDWRTYALRRFARLYAVYLVALLLGSLLDHTGLLWFSDTGVYTHAVNFPMLFYNVSTRLDAGTFIGNLFFCQSVVVPSYGSNVPLWSLANEAWYYLLFPLLAVPFLSPLPNLRKIAAFLLLAVSAWFVRGPILLYASIWLLGVLVHIPARPFLGRAWPALTVLAGLMLVTRLHFLEHVPLIARDLGLGAAFALVLQTLSHTRAGAFPLAILHRNLAGFSYSLYLCHWPLGLFTAAASQHVLGFGLRSPLSAAGLCFYSGLLILVYGAAWLLSRWTEHRTTALRARLAVLFGLPKPAVPAT
ncbi:MAG: acyltransferase family protein [Opitutales bacterium]